MKTIFLQLFLLSFFPLPKTIFAQGCPNTTYRVDSQSDIDIFPTLYPDCTNLIYDLIIEGSNNHSIRNLDSLRQIKTINGDLVIETNWSLTSLNGLEGLTHINGDLEVRDIPKLRDFSGLSNLERIGGRCLIYLNDSLQSLFGLSKLEIIGNRFVIFGNKKLSDLTSLNNLEEIGGRFELNGSDSLKTLSGISSLREINGEFNISNCPTLIQLTDFPHMDSIKAKLVILNTGLPNLEGFTALKHISGAIDIDANNNLKNLQGLENVTYSRGLYITGNAELLNFTGLDKLKMTGEIRIIENPSLLNFSGLTSLEHVTNRFFVGTCHALESFEGLERLETIENGEFYVSANYKLKSFKGLGQLRFIEQRLVIANNLILESLDGLNSLAFIGGDLDIDDNRELSEINSLSNLRNVNGNHLYITRNSKLTSIQGMANVDLSEIPEISISGNPLLNTCHLENVCNRILSNPLTSYVNNGNDNCKNHEEILSHCEIIPKVVYEIFFDENQNKLRDIEELEYPPARIEILPASTFHFPNSITGGTVYLSPGLHEISYFQEATPNWELTTDSATYHFNINDTTFCDTIRFGIYPTFANTEFYSLSNLSSVRCNENSEIKFSGFNQGATIASGTIWGRLDENLELLSYFENSDTLGNNGWVGWNFEELFPGQKVEVRLSAKLPGPPDFAVGDSIHLLSYLQFSDQNGSHTSLTDTNSIRIRCSYDPNDKLVQPDRISKLTLFEEKLFYTIRFQNTGNDLAYDITIRDTLDEHLDVTTFRLLDSSHPLQLQTSLAEGRYLSFDFKNILLPDSTSNPEGSQGYVTFMIDSKDDLPEQTIINNSASIYFDLNPPIRTNTTENILVSELVSGVHDIPEEISFKIIPNPTNGIFEIRTSLTELSQLTISNCTGKLIYQDQISNDEIIDISKFSAGLYFITLGNKFQNISKKLIKF